MTDAPERIWAVPERNCTVYMSGNSPITAQDGPFKHHRHGAASEYIRADLVEALEAENQRLREALQRAYDHVLRDAPDWFMRHSHEQQALEVERSAALSALRSTESG